jgi:hypothetical protein
LMRWWMRMRRSQWIFELRFLIFDLDLDTEAIERFSRKRAKRKT